MFKLPRIAVLSMSLEKKMECPQCEAIVSFYRTAAMNTQLGEKRKWRCPECEYGFVQVGEISSLSDA
jgi:hypothetical protein